MGAHFGRPALGMRGAKGVYPWAWRRGVCTLWRRVSPCPRGRSILVWALPSAQAQPPFVKSGGGSAWLIGWSRAQSTQMYTCPNEGAQLGLTDSLGGWFLLRALLLGGEGKAHCALRAPGPRLPAFAATGDTRLLPWKQNRALFFQKTSQSNLWGAGLCECDVL